MPSVAYEEAASCAVPHLSACSSAEDKAGQTGGGHTDDKHTLADVRHCVVEVIRVEDRACKLVPSCDADRDVQGSRAGPRGSCTPLRSYTNLALPHPRPTSVMNANERATQARCTAPGTLHSGGKCRRLDTSHLAHNTILGSNYSIPTTVSLSVRVPTTYRGDW